MPGPVMAVRILFIINAMLCGFGGVLAYSTLWELGSLPDELVEEIGASPGYVLSALVMALGLLVLYAVGAAKAGRAEKAGGTFVRAVAVIGLVLQGFNALSGIDLVLVMRVR